MPKCKGRSGVLIRTNNALNCKKSCNFAAEYTVYRYSTSHKYVSNLDTLVSIPDISMLGEIMTYHSKEHWSKFGNIVVKKTLSGSNLSYPVQVTGFRYMYHEEGCN